MRAPIVAFSGGSRSVWFLLHGVNRAMDEDLSLEKANSKADEGATVRKAQAVLERSSPSINQVCLVALTVLAVIYTLYFAAAVILPFVLALVLTALLSPALVLMNRRLRVPRAIAALCLIFVVLAVIWAVAYLVVVPASNWIARIPQYVPTLVEKLSFLQRPIKFLEEGLKAFQDAVPRDGAQKVVEVRQSTEMGGQMLGIGTTVLVGGRAFVGQVLTVMLLLFFFLASSESLLRRVVEILPHFNDKRRVVSIVSDTEDSISHYLLTVSLMNALVGVVTGLAVWFLGMPDPVLFGTIAFLLNYIPILGPLTGVMIFLFAGIFSFPTALQALFPAGIYLGIHILEGEMITPMLLAHRFTLNPVMVISSLLFWDWLWGVPGALLSTPLLAVIKIVCDHIEVLAPLGHLIGGTSGKELKQNERS
jgi:predicted PurR-regulated permease PerM